MKLPIVIETVICCVLIGGCAGTVGEEGLDKRIFDRELVNTVNDTAIQYAIISQHTLFPYHFVNNSNRLNELGEFDLNVLANHFLKNPGQLNIRRDDTPEELYQARVSFVLERLENAGIESEKIAFSDGMPGGSGMPSEKILTILDLERENKKPAGEATRKTSSLRAK